MANRNLIFEEIIGDGGGGEGETKLELDASLTQEGKAADAKAVGDAIAGCAKKTDLAGYATEGYVDGEISDSLSQFDTNIKKYIEETLIGGKW